MNKPFSPSVKRIKTEMVALSKILSSTKLNILKEICFMITKGNEFWIVPFYDHIMRNMHSDKIANMAFISWIEDEMCCQELNSECRCIVVKYLIYRALAESNFVIHKMLDSTTSIVKESSFVLTKQLSDAKRTETFFVDCIKSSKVALLLPGNKSRYALIQNVSNKDSLRKRLDILTEILKNDKGEYSTSLYMLASELARKIGFRDQQNLWCYKVTKMLCHEEPSHLKRFCDNDPAARDELDKVEFRPDIYELYHSKIKKPRQDLLCLILAARNNCEDSLFCKYSLPLDLLKIMLRISRLI